MSNTDKPLIVFLDNVGRTIIAKKRTETADTVTVENPALVHIQANPQTSQLHLQIFPLFFKEFQENKNEPTVWHYKKSSITLSDPIAFPAAFNSQYEQLFFVAQPKAQPEVVKLFDE